MRYYRLASEPRVCPKASVVPHQCRLGLVLVATILKTVAQVVNPICNYLKLQIKTSNSSIIILDLNTVVAYLSLLKLST
jgi:hypothetical protein